MLDTLCRKRLPWAQDQCYISVRRAQWQKCVRCYIRRVQRAKIWFTCVLDADVSLPVCFAQVAQLLNANIKTRQNTRRILLDLTRTCLVQPRLPSHFLNRLCSRRIFRLQNHSINYPYPMRPLSMNISFLLVLVRTDPNAYRVVGNG